jgi:HEAT repeat protein
MHTAEDRAKRAHASLIALTFALLAIALVAHLLLVPALRARRPDLKAAEARGDDEAAARAQRARALGRSSDPAAPERLAQLLSDPSPEVRAEAAIALGTRGDIRATEPLCALLADDDAKTRVRAASALGAIGTPATPDVIRAVRDGRPDVQEAAAQALGAIGDTTATAALIQVLSESDYVAVRVQSLGALGQIGGAASEQAAAAALADEDAGVRLAAVEALSDIGTPDAAAALKAALQDRDENVRSRAAGALRDLGERRGSGDRRWRKAE